LLCGPLASKDSEDIAEVTFVCEASTKYEECTGSEPVGTHPEPVVKVPGVGTRRNPSGTRRKSAWGLGASTNFEKCTASEPVGTRPEPVRNPLQKCLGPRPQLELPKVACLGTRWNPSRNPSKFEEASHGIATFGWHPAFYL
jgi:hypothetical protein